MDLMTDQDREKEQNKKKLDKLVRSPKKPKLDYDLVYSIAYMCERFNTQGQEKVEKLSQEMSHKFAQKVISEIKEYLNS